MTAELAKLKGFDVNTGPNCWVKTLDGEIIHNKLRKDTPEHDRSKLHLLQPTQTILQKWLREVHNIEVSVNVNFYNKSKKLGYYYSIDKFDSNDIHDGEDYDSDQLELIGNKKGFNIY